MTLIDKIFFPHLFPLKQNNQILELNEYDKTFGFTVQEAAHADIFLYFMSGFTGTQLMPFVSGLKSLLLHPPIFESTLFLLICAKDHSAISQQH